MAQKLEGKRTAMVVAAARAMGSKHPDEKVRNPDYLAEHFLPFPYRPLVKFGLGRKLMMRKFENNAKGVYFFQQARTRHIDSVLLSELERGVEQVVILGAGFDSRAHRLRQRLEGRPVFEVDHPGTQGWKRERLRRLPPGVANEVRYVPIDFNRERLETVLAGAGFDARRRTFFLWEGVTMYLTQEAIDTTLAYIHAVGSGSSVIFDYIFKGILDGTADYYGAKESIRAVSKSGEPYVWGLEPGGVGAFLDARGFELVSDLGPTELMQRYLISSDGHCIGRLTEYLGLAHGRVRG
jgi:methyltransferase (TIGR00027 family)